MKELRLKMNRKNEIEDTAAGRALISLKNYRRSLDITIKHNSRTI
jgi:hypothetical protein